MPCVYVLTVEHPTGSWGVMAVTDSFEGADHALHGEGRAEPYGAGEVDWGVEVDQGHGMRIWSGKSGSRRFAIWERELINHG